MVKSNEKTNTGEGDKGKRGRTVSDDTGGKSLSDTSTSARGQCVGESSTGVKSTVILDWHWKRAQRISRVIRACLCPVCTPKHQRGHGG